MPCALKLITGSRAEAGAQFPGLSHSDDTLLEALETYVKCQRKRLGVEKKEVAN
jgi:hypothetical protein